MTAALDHGKEADAFDITRGGEPRTAAATDTVRGLLPDHARRLLDVACGTGIVTRNGPPRPAPAYG